MFGSFGSTTIRPMWKLFSRPTFTQVLPASVDLYTPSPQYVLREAVCSPVPT